MYNTYKPSALDREHTALQNNTSLHFLQLNFALLDPDRHSQCGFGSGSSLPKLIRIHVDPGPPYWFFLQKTWPLKSLGSPNSVTVMEFNGQRTIRKKPCIGRYTQINWVWSSSTGFAPVCRTVGPGFDSLPDTLRGLFAELKQ